MGADDTPAAAEAAGSDSVAETITQDAGGTSGEVGGSEAGSLAKAGQGAGANGKAKPAAGVAAGAGQSAMAAVNQEKGPPQEWELMDIPFEWRPRVLVKVRPLPNCRQAPVRTAPAWAALVSVLIRPPHLGSVEESLHEACRHACAASSAL